MEKDPSCGIREHLRDVPSGKFLMIRHPLSGDVCIRDFSDAALPADTKLKTETYMLYP